MTEKTICEKCGNWVDLNGNHCCDDMRRLQGMTSENDLIRRGDALALFKSYDWRGSWLAPIMKGKADAIAALPAVTADAPSVPEVGSVVRALDSVIAEMHHLRAALRGLEDRG